jgi:hypothetical protein
MIKELFIDESDIYENNPNVGFGQFPKSLWDIILLVQISLSIEKSRSKSYFFLFGVLILVPYFHLYLVLPVVLIFDFSTAVTFGLTFES